MMHAVPLYFKNRTTAPFKLDDEATLYGPGQNYYFVLDDRNILRIPAGIDFVMAVRV